MKNDYTRSVTLLCPTCASPELRCKDELETEESRYICAACEGEFAYCEIKASNEEQINATVEEMKAEIISDIRQDFKKMFK